MSSILYFSVAVELIIIFSAIIFISLLSVTKILNKRVLKNGVLLFLNVLFITLFYLLINLNWTQLAIPLIGVFVPSTLSVGLFFYRFNTEWLSLNFKPDKYIGLFPIVVFVISIFLEIANLILNQNSTIRDARIFFTESVMLYAFPAYNGIIILFNFLKLKKAERINSNSYSTDDVVNLNWSRLTLIFFFLFYLGMILSGTVNDTVSEILFNSSLLLLTLYLGYYQIRAIGNYIRLTQKGVNQENDELDKVKLDDQNEISRLNELYESLDQIVNEKRLYLKEDLSLYDLSIIMEMNPKYLSQAINQQSDLNFNKYINEKRIKHAAVLIKDSTYDTLTLEGIATESGFRSKSTFNSAFKSIMGCTPSEYKKRDS